MLVPFDGSPPAQHLLRMACQAALRESTPLVVLCMVRIPAGRAADETPPAAEAAVMRAMVEATEISRQEGVIAIFRATYATDFAAEILRVAEEMHATVIAMSIDEWSGNGADQTTELMSPIVQRVLAGAHCTVLIEAEQPHEVTSEPTPLRPSTR
jgi:hypothetical protein